MSRDARKKERQRLKRKQKQLAMRREQSRTALQRIASDGGALECWVNDGWQEQGIASIVVLGRASGGSRAAVASFLVDLWCVGLKDAWGSPDTTEHEFRQNILEPLKERGNGTRLDPATARRLVAGGIRFARQNGFRLPPHWERWVSIFGGDLGDLKAADLSDFGLDGKLRYVGTMDFLHKRLIACTPEQFIQRPDVDVVLGDLNAAQFGLEGQAWEDAEDEEDVADAGDDEEIEDEDDEKDVQALMQIIDQMSGKLVGEVRKWCFANAVAPHPMLEQGAIITLTATLPLAAQFESPEAVTVDDERQAGALAQDLLAEYSPQERAEILEATEQIGRYLKQFSSPAEAISAFGFNEENDAEG